MSDNENEKEDAVLSKFNLDEGDVLVVKVDISNLSEEEAIAKISSVREEPVLKELSDSGTKVLFTYTGIDLSVLKLGEGDKLVIYADTSSFESEEDKDSYMGILKSKVSSQIDGHDVVVVPIDRTALYGAVDSTGE